MRQGTAAELLTKLADECGATVCHVVADDVCERPRAMMMAGCAALEQSGLQVQRWDNGCIQSGVLNYLFIGEWSVSCSAELMLTVGL